MGISYKRKREYDEEVDFGVSSASEDEASKFERTRSTFKKQGEAKKKKKLLLPIKQKGKIVQKELDVSTVEPTKEEEGYESEEESEDEEGLAMAKVFDEFADSEDDSEFVGRLQDEDEEDDDERSEAEKLAERKAKVDQYILKIGNTCADIVENPEVHYKRLNELLQMTKMAGGAGFAIKKIAILSLSEVFADILPDYKIKDDAKPAADGPKLKKETRQLMAYERTLLKLYKRFLLVCEDFVQLQYRALRKQRQKRNGRKDSKKKAKESRFKLPPHLLQLSKAAIQAICRVFVARPYFNYREQVSTLVVNNLVNRDVEISDICYNCLKQIYKEDRYGETVFECVKRTKLLVKSYTAKLPPKVLYSLLNLRINKAQSAEQQAVDLKKVREKIKKMSRQERRRHKDMQKLEKQLLEARAEDSEERTSKVHTEILKQLMNIYFWILKRDEKPTQLLTPLLEGLSKYAHLVNIEFFDDLLNVLYNLIDQEELNESQTCHCLLTVFKILGGQGQVLNVDPTRYYTLMYSTLLSLNNCVSHDFTPTILQCLDLTLLKKKDASQQRLLAFTKRLLTTALQTNDASTLALLSMARSLFTSHKQLDILLDNEVGSGHFNPELQDPEHCNAASATAWETTLLTKHYVPMVRRFAALIADGSRGLPDKFVLNLSKATPAQVYGAFSKRDAADVADEADKGRRSISSKPILWQGESIAVKAEGIFSFLQDDIDLWN
ncbi:nucleolar complex protein 3 homolog [Galendromus occidentalis]|uniref:NOC3-like protein n=1 Tax=Galendromus occidentalis TaxID=34638 RepID=A0AAJ7SF18_9ACAR|nr:nucleolar complex protein 3 homolog [Galendromus occidentalis]